MRKFNFDNLEILTEDLSLFEAILEPDFGNLSVGLSLLDDSVMGPIEIFFGPKTPLPLSQAFFGTEGNDVFDISDLATNDSYDARGGNDIVGFGMNAFNVGLTITLDGGTGIDHLQIATSYRNYGGDTLDGDNDFGGVVDITNNVVGGYGNFTISNFERLTIEGGGFGDLFRGGSGRDEIKDGGFAVTVDGNGSQDYGLGGNDEIYGMGGNDLIIGTGGQDILDGGAGNDVIESGGNYTRGYYDAVGDNSYQTFVTSQALMIGGEGNDNIKSNGDDTLEGGAGDDALINERGSAIAVYSSADAADYEIIRTGTGIYTVEAIGGTGEGFDTLSGIETIRLGGIDGTDYDITELEAPGDTIFGTPGDDVLTGTFFNDTIDGLAGDDTLNGADGDDILIGGAGRDRLLGDGGDDTLVFTHDDIVANGGAGDDILSYSGADYSGSVILDGSVGTDTLYLESAYTGSGLANFDLRGSTISRTEIIELRAEASGADYDPIWLQMDWAQLADVQQILGYAADDIFIYGDAGDTIDLTNLQVIGFGGQLYIAGSDTLIVDNDNVSWQGASGDSSFAALYDELSDWNFSANGGAGFDVVDFSGMSDSYNLQQIGGYIGLLTVDLSTGSVALTQTNLGNSTDATASLTSIEQIIGWEGENRLSGSASADRLDGNRAGDIFEGRGGDDILNGFGGTDTAIYSSANPDDYIITENAPGDYTVEAIGGTGEGTDTLTSVEFIRLGGSDGQSYRLSTFNQNTFGTEGDDTAEIFEGDAYYALGGNDTVSFVMTGQAVLANGGDGIDQLIIDTSEFNSSVDPDSANNFGGYFDVLYDYTSGDYANITISNFETLIMTGGGKADSLYGGNGDDVLNDGGFFATFGPVFYTYGEGGNDILIGRWGDDILVGTGGIDYFDGGSGNDVITSGGHYARGYDDASTGDSFSEIIISQARMFGGEGNDILNSYGVDVLYGGGGDDVLINHENSATAIYHSTNATDYVIRETAPGEYTVQAVGGTGEGTDTLTGIETIRLGGQNGTDYDISTLSIGGSVSLTNGDDTYTADDYEVVHGLDGNDILYAEGRNITLNGDGGNDTLFDTSTGRENTLNGGIGVDSLRIETFGSIANGDDGNDNIVLGLKGYTANGGAGDDIITVTRSFEFGFAMIANGGAGNDTLIFRYDDSQDLDNDNRYGGTFDMSTGTSSSDYRLMTSGFESLDFVGGGETDTVTGTAGNDIIEDGGFYSFTGGTSYYGYGNGGDDFLYGMDGNDTLIGTGGTDLLDGGDGNDVITSGADYISGYDDPVMDIYFAETLDSAAVMLGGAGNDTLNSHGNDVLEGGSGDDILINHEDGAVAVYSSANTADYIVTETAPGEYTVQAVGGTGEGTDTLTGIETIRLGGQNGTDYDISTLVVVSGDIDLTSYDDIYSGTAADEVINGLDGNDIIDGGAGNNTLNGDAGDDTLISLGNDNLNGGTGDDLIEMGGNVFDTATATDGGADIDTISFSTLAPLPSGNLFLVLDLQGQAYSVRDGSAVLYVDQFTNFENATGSEYRDLLQGDAGMNVLQGLGGDDNLQGREGDDIIDGGAGNDLLSGGTGSDILDGGAGTDTLTYQGLAGELTIDLLTGSAAGLAAGDTHINIENIIGSNSRNVLRGDNMDNVLTGGDANDTLFGRNGDDMLIGGQGTDTLTGGRGDDALFGGDGADGLNGDDGNDTIDGGAGADFILGDNGNDTIDGGAGNDRIFGDAGTDIINGGDGDDEIEGGAGDDIIDGGAGENDTAYYESTFGITVNYLGGTTYQVTGASGDEGTDTLIGIEFVRAQTTSYDIALLVNGTAAARNLTNNDDDFTGGSADEIINALDGDDIIRGQGGDDTINGDGGDDILNGGSGNDILNGGAGNNALNGDSGHDILISLGNDVLNGGTGDDLIEMGGNVFDTATATDGGADIDTISFSTLAQFPSGNLFLVIDLQGQAYSVRDGSIVQYVDQFTNFENATGSEFSDLLQGDAGVNLLTGLGGDDNLQGRDGDDIIDGGAGADILNGGRGTDLATYGSAMAGVTAIIGDASLNTGDAAGDSYIDIENITGTDFDDVLGGDANANIIDGGAGIDIASYAYASSAIVFDGLGLVTASGDIIADTLVNIEAIGGTNFDDRLFGDNDASIFYGGQGNDRLFGRNGDDQLFGEGGNDILLGGRDNDLIDGGAGNDQLRGNEGDDTIFGGDGNDVLTGGAGADAMDGGAGIDRVEYTYGTNAGVTASLGNSAINTGDAAGDTYVNIENLYGTSFVDTLYGDAGNNRIDGRVGDDALFGGEGNDYLLGGSGNDVLNGEGGNDLLLGQAGADIYQFDGAHGTDRIIIFTQGEDLIEFTEGVFDFSGLTITQDGAHVNIVSSEGTIIANNSLVADFTADDFIFAPPPAQEPLDITEQDLAMFVEVDALI